MAIGCAQELAPGDAVTRRAMDDRVLEAGIVVAVTGPDPARPGVTVAWPGRVERMSPDDAELLVGTVVRTTALVVP